MRSWVLVQDKQFSFTVSLWQLLSTSCMPVVVWALVTHRGEQSAALLMQLPPGGQTTNKGISRYAKSRG